MTRFEFYDKYRLHIPIPLIRQFESDLGVMVQEEVIREREWQEEVERR